MATSEPAAILAAAAEAGLRASAVGQAGGDALTAPGLFDLPLARLREAHEGWLPGYMGD